MAGLSAANLKERATELAGKFTTGQKALMGGVTLAVIVALFMVTKAAGQQEMSALYSNLKPTDASAVTEKLTAEGTTYTLADGGATIMVPKEKVYDLRLKMAADNLPESSPDGYALLDKQGITTSEFSQQVGFQRAMEGELTKTIAAMDPIEQATVHLAIPKDNVFAASEAKASASVLVKVKPGKQVDSGQVQAIVHLVASSVNGLAPEAVTVADSKGQVLAAPGADGTDSAAGDLNTKQRAAYEKTVATSIQAMVEPVVGPGKAKVTVAADLDFNQKNATSEVFQQPSGNVAQGTPQAQTQKTETYTGAGAADAGVLGPDGAPVTGGANGGDTNYQLNQTETKNALNRVVEQTKSAPGSVRRMSVAVLLDSGSSTADQVTQIQNLVAAAAGINTQRGDAVQVSRLAFDTSEADAQQKELEEAQAAEERAATMGTVRQLVVVLFLAGLVFLVYRSMRKATRRRPSTLYAGEVREIPTTPDEPLVLERPMETLPVPVEAESAPEPEDEDDLLDLTPIRTEEQIQRDRISRQIDQMIEQQPAEVAQMLRGWLGESKKGVKK
jgi:flagellar M-ring protein FliF